MHKQQIIVSNTQINIVDADKTRESKITTRALDNITDEIMGKP